MRSKGVDYVVTRVMDTTAATTVERGVTIAFEQQAGIGVYDNGSLLAEGTREQAIMFVGTTASSGCGIGIRTQRPTSKLCPCFGLTFSRQKLDTGVMRETTPTSPNHRGM
ncbi:MAG: hypothetical protein ACN4G0_08945 [Polyangiales bacterium]